MSDELRRESAPKFDHQAHEEHEGVGAKFDALSRIIVDAGLSVHKALGPGLLESTYEHCLLHELQTRGVACLRQVPIPIVYKGAKLDAGYRIDLVVDNSIVVEVKAVEALTRLHEAQILTYLRLAGFRIGLLMNFNVVLFKNGLRRFVL